ncbi:hypothetical protein H5410_019488 [Solanum commersonii]|uniref:NRC1 n=1 Tax=Solanum commersonii TaxID=4109 RepID=A0A9J5Z8H5_SOLCO|nr:hypothetical protein H5410_019488 [Solanum commersonii]
MVDAVVNFLVENLLQLINENAKLIGNDAAKFGYTNSEQWKVLVIEIHKTVHRAEDAIDKFLVQAKLHQDKYTMGRIFDWPRNLMKVRNLAAEIKGIHDQVKELRSSNHALQVTPIIELPKKGEVTQGPSLESDAVIGFDAEANKVIKRLVEGPTESVDIIPVVGMPGLGKTTLARKIYNDSKLTYEFYSIVWVYVGQECKAKDIYLRILKFFKKNIEDHLNDDVDTLAKAIGGYIKKGGRCLIVLEDVWEDEVIDHVMKVFTENEKGHRIMMTTRDLRLAKFANLEPHELKFLETEESFELLVMKVFGKGSCPNELVVVGKKIAEKCGGVPLVVVVIAGALRGRSDKKDWERVDKNVVQHFGEHTEDSCLKFVKMSYDHLPQEVQMCFLYCGVFPRGFDIPCWKLIRLWIAEGLIKPQPEFTLEEIAEGLIKPCRLHDMLYQFCKKEASSKWLFQEPDQSKLDPDTCRRLCIQPSNLSDFLSTTPVAEHGPPSTFGKFWNLQTLILNTSTLEPTLEVKADVWNLLQLRHLHTNIPAKLPSPTTTTGKPSFLQTLSMVVSESCEKDVLAKACNVKKLSIRGKMAAFLGAYKGGINNLEELQCLEHLKLLNDVLFINKALHLPPAFSKLVRTVKKLTLTNTRFAWSEADKLGTLESLEVLKFKENAFMGHLWKPKSGFSALQVLWIERSELESWEASVINFPMLRQLVLISCVELDAVPLELADIPSLQEMRLDNTSKAVKSVKNVRDSKTSKSMKLKLSIFPPENESKVAQ